MPENTSASVLQRKVANEPATPEMAAMTPVSALRKACVRAAQNFGGLVLTATRVAQDRLSVPGLVSMLPEPAMLMLLDGPDNSFGLAVADTQFLAAVLEHSTTGRVVPAKAEPRRATPTDASIVSGLVDLILQEFGKNLSTAEKAPPVQGFRFGLSLDEPLAIPLALAEMPYRMYRLTLDFDGGAKTGDLMLVFPWYRSSVEQLDRRNAKQWKDSLHGAVCASRVEVEAVLHRMSLPFAEVSQWQVGTLLPVPIAALAQVAVQGSNGQAVAQARLGQAAGKRAIRIQYDVAPVEEPYEQVNLGPDPSLDANDPPELPDQTIPPESDAS